MEENEVNGIIELLMEKDVLLSPELLIQIKNLKNKEESEEFLEKITNNEELVFNKKHLETEQKKQTIKPKSVITNTPKILFSYAKESHKRTVDHFVGYFRARYKTLSNMLSKRNEMQGAISISRALNKKEKENIAVIGMIHDIAQTKNNHLILTIEDLSGTIKVLINKNRPDLLEDAKFLVKDEVIGIVGSVNDKMIFANTFLLPDLPLTKEFKKSPNEEYAAFIGDPHFGSKVFLKKEFEKLIRWFNGEIGDENQKNMASKLKYLFIVGDLVEGIGIYPSQENDLEFPDIYEQYKIFADYIKQIPEHVQIIICPGNHDAVRIGEPQPRLYTDVAAPIYELKNTHLVSNPSMVNICSTQDFEGIDVLLYHGFSFPFYADNIEPIRIAGGQKKADLIMQALLRKRHLAPTHASNLYIPDPESDSMVITHIPDIFATGHIHRTTAKNYHNITLLNCSCWLATTAYQEKIGLVPQPAKLPVVNLQTREIKVINFGAEKGAE